MCQQLSTSFSLKTGPDEVPTAAHAEAAKSPTGIAVHEMAHLVLDPFCPLLPDGDPIHE